MKRSRVSAVLLLATLSSAGPASAGNSLRVTADDLGSNIRITGRYQVSNPPYCLAARPSPGASSSTYRQWSDPRCVPYIAQHGSFRVTVLYKGRPRFSDSFAMDGPYWNPLQGGRINPYYIYCRLLQGVRSATGRTYRWNVTLIDPFHRPGYNLSRGGTFHCARVSPRSRPR
jgi:hypothetical protein